VAARRRATQEVLGVCRALRHTALRYDASHLINRPLLDTGRSGPFTAARANPLHDAAPDRSGDLATGRAAQDALPLIEADPHGADDLWRVAAEPHVRGVLRRAGLACGSAAEADSVHACARAAVHDVLHHGRRDE